MVNFYISLVPRPVQKIGEKGLVSTVRACTYLVRKAHVKLYKCMSNDGQYHVVMSYDDSYISFILYRSRSEDCSPSPFPRPSDSHHLLLELRCQCRTHFPLQM